MLTDNDLYNLVKKAGEENEEEAPIVKDPPARKLYEKTKELGSKAIMGVGAVGAGLASLAKPVEPMKIDPKL